MISVETGEAAASVLTAALTELLECMATSAATMPNTLSHARLRFEALQELAEEAVKISSAGAALLRRSDPKGEQE